MASRKKGAAVCQMGQAALAARLLERFAAGARGGGGGGSNLIFSPLSIHVALALMSAGAAGDTLAEILAVASAPSREELTAFVGGSVVDRVLAVRSGVGGPRVAFACGAWTDRRCPLKPAYRDTIVKTFKGNAAIVDFVDHPVESREQINAWVAEATRGLITELVDPHEQRTAAVNVVVNAIYFRGEWSDPFEAEHTADREFRRLDGGSVEAPFMRSWSHRHVACHDGFKALKLPYKQANGQLSWKQLRRAPRFAMCVLLPDAEDGLPRLVERVAASPGFVRDHLPATPVPVGEFRLPRFKLAFGGSVVGDLRSLGLVLPFEPSMASMTEMVEDAAAEDGGRVYVADVIHKAVIEVNEEGSLAAAATESDDDVGFSLYDDYVPPKPVDFVADHPFAFFIVEETSGAIVFAGQVLDPTKEGGGGGGGEGGYVAGSKTQIGWPDAWFLYISHHNFKTTLNKLSNCD